MKNPLSRRDRLSLAWFLGAVREKGERALNSRIRSKSETERLEDLRQALEDALWKVKKII